VRRPGERGFTLIEMMIVVVMIAVLAAIAVPLFTSDANSSKGESEALAMCGAMSIAEEQYKLEHSAYLSTGTSESNTWPVSPSSQPQALTPYPALWTSLGVHSQLSSARCAYVVIAGPAGGGSPGSVATSFGFSVPAATPWYYCLARCDNDHNAAVDAYFFQSSTDPSQKELNPDR
jgi:prepilin-type N-terminal cleavage/methylation domain-containing protein